jgi:hypothetical protein
MALQRPGFSEEVSPTLPNPDVRLPVCRMLIDSSPILSHAVSKLACPCGGAKQRAHMATPDQPPSHPTVPAVSAPAQMGSQGPYTGVVLIHGLGEIGRNTMLQQAVNALSY